MIKDVVINSLNLLSAKIKQRMAEENENASGRTSNSIRIKTEGQKIALVIGGEKTAELSTLEKGIAPHHGVSVSAIYRWSEEKGLFFANEKGRFIFSLLTAQKIENFGTERFRNNVDIYTTAREETVADLRKFLKQELKNIIKG